MARRQIRMPQSVRQYRRRTRREKDGPGSQERINDALRKAAGLRAGDRGASEVFKLVDVVICPRKKYGFANPESDPF
jgi:hypothetical protein